MVQNQTSAYALTGLLSKGIQDDRGNGIIAEDVILHEDEGFRTAYTLKHLMIEDSGLIDDLYLVSLNWRRTACPLRKQAEAGGSLCGRRKEA